MTESGVSEGKNYWESRAVNSTSKLGSAIKRSRLTQGAADILFSVRASDEIFVSQVLKARGARSVLDIACGPGKSVIGSIAEYTAGVDIPGYPAEIARSKGYDECVEYEPPEYDFQISRNVDLVTAINLNAHVPPEAYQQILRQALKFLNPGGSLLLIHEYDNEGVSYRWMYNDLAKFDRFVRGMEHWHLDFERNFVEMAARQFPDLALVRRRPLTGGFLPAIHYYAYAAEKNPGPFLQKCFALADVPISILNYVQCRLTRSFNKCFLVGYVYEKRS